MTLVPVGLLASVAAWHFGGELRQPLLAATPMMITVALYQWRLGVTWGMRRFDIAVVGYLVFFGLLLGLLPLSLAHPSPIVATLLLFGFARGVHAALLWVWTHKSLRKLTARSRSLDERNRTSPDLRKELLSYATQMAVVALFGAILWERTALPFLKARGDFVDIGLYTAAFGICVLFLRVPGVLAQVVLPVAAELEGAGAPPEALGAIFRRTSRFLTLLVAPPAIVLWVATPQVIELMYGNPFQDSGRILRILLLPLVFSGAAAAGAKTLVGSGNQGRLVRVVLVAAALKMLLCLILVPWQGALGAAIAVAISWSTGMILEAWSAGRCFPVHSQRESGIGARSITSLVGLVLGTALAAALGTHVAEGAPALLCLVVILLVGGLGAVVSAAFFRPLTGEDIDALAQSDALCRVPGLIASLRRVSI
jgi:O-antigen/teichoic acid export membrane protein